MSRENPGYAFVSAAVTRRASPAAEHRPWPLDAEPQQGRPRGTRLGTRGVAHLFIIYHPRVVRNVSYSFRNPYRPSSIVYRPRLGRRATDPMSENHNAVARMPTTCPIRPRCAQ